MALSHIETRALQALRAPGGMTAEQAWERLPGSGALPLHALVRRGLAARDGEAFVITAAGRAACPFTNPILAAQAAGKAQEENIMTAAKLDKTSLLAAIDAAGPDGTTAAQLAVLFGVSNKDILNRLWPLTHDPNPAVCRPRRGLLVAARFIDVADTLTADPVVGGALTPSPSTLTPCPSPRGRGEANLFPLPVGEGSRVRAGRGEAPEEEVAKIAREYDEMIDFDLGPAGTEMSSGGPENVKPVDRDEELIRQERAIIGLRALIAEQQEKLAEILAREGTKLVVADIDIDDPETVAFAVWSSGGLDIVTDGPTVSLSSAALGKLRAFLGLFAEAA